MVVSRQGKVKRLACYAVCNDVVKCKVWTDKFINCKDRMEKNPYTIYCCLYRIYYVFCHHFDIFFYTGGKKILN